MAIHRIKAKDDTPAKSAGKSKTPPKKPKPKTKKPHSKPVRILLIPLAPFRAIGRYIRNSWRELRQVRWPNRKLTWKMTLSVILFVIIFAAVIMLLDALFQFLFTKLLGA